MDERLRELLKLKKEQQSQVELTKNLISDERKLLAKKRKELKNPPCNKAEKIRALENENKRLKGLIMLYERESGSTYRECAKVMNLSEGRCRELLQQEERYLLNYRVECD